MGHLYQILMSINQKELIGWLCMLTIVIHFDSFGVESISKEI